MHHAARYLMLSTLCLVLSRFEADDKYKTILSRKRRYVVFPEGSTFSVSTMRCIDLSSRASIICEQDSLLNTIRRYYSYESL